jgi:LysM repeat protein
VAKLRDDRQRLINYALKLKKQNALLMKRLRGDSMTVSAPDRKAGKIKIVTEAVREIYTVKSGDNLQKISRAVYGTAKYYKLIFNANRDILDSESKLCIGQKLKIPEIKKIPEEKEMPESSSGL